MYTFEIAKCVHISEVRTHYITPPKATHLSTARKSNAPPNTISGVSIANRDSRAVVKKKINNGLA